MRPKQEIRRIVQEFRKTYSPEALKKWSGEICKKIDELLVYKKSKYIAFYFPKPGEVDLRELMGKALLGGKKVFLPRVHLKEKDLTFHQIFSLSDVVPGPFSLKEPKIENPTISPEKLELILVPGVAFDLKRNRIGYGGGFYDRVLSKTNAVKIGVAFSFQIFKALPSESHDQPLDLIITERGII